MIATKHFYFERMPFWCFWRIKHWWFTVRVGPVAFSLWLNTYRWPQFALHWKGVEVLGTPTDTAK